MARTAGTRSAVTSVLVAGLGETGVRTARQLLDTPGVDRVFVAATTERHAESIAEALHDGAEPWVLGHDVELPRDVDAVASAVPAAADAAVARASVERGIPFASAVDDDGALRTLLALDAPARSHATRVVAGCGLAPGLADVLARHATGVLESVDEVHVARFGVGGAACAATAASRAARAERGVARVPGRPRPAPRRGAHLVPGPGRCARVRARRDGCRLARELDAGRDAGHGAARRAGRAPVRAGRKA